MKTESQVTMAKTENRINVHNTDTSKVLVHAVMCLLTHCNTSYWGEGRELEEVFKKMDSLVQSSTQAKV